MKKDIKNSPHSNSTLFSFWSKASQLKQFPPKGQCQRLETFLVVTAGRGGGGRMLPASSGQGQGCR